MNNPTTPTAITSSDSTLASNPAIQSTPEASANPVASAPTPTPDLINIEDFFKIKLNVGEIVAAEKIEKSKKLLKLQVNLGTELGQRQILSGIAQFYTPEQLIGRRIVVVTNLKPAKMMGLESQGMLLAASNADHSVLTIVSPGAEVPLGASVS